MSNNIAKAAYQWARATNAMIVMNEHEQEQEQQRSTSNNVTTRACKSNTHRQHVDVVVLIRARHHEATQHLVVVVESMPGIRETGTRQ